MTSRRTFANTMLAIATGLMVGCSSVPSTSTMTSTTTEPQAGAATTDTQVPFSFDESTLTPEEEGLTQGAYTLQQYGYRNYWHIGPRCRWFWVPSGWGYPYWRSWQGGRWVLICGRRNIPWWWYAGPYGSIGGYGGFGRTGPRFRPNFPDRFRDFDRDRGGRGGRFDRDGRDGGVFDRDGRVGPPRMGGDDEGPRGPRGPRNPGPDD